MTARRLLVVASLVLVAATAAWRLRSDEFRLPARIELETVVADLPSSLDAAAVEQQATGDPVRRGGIQPGWNIAVNGGYRHALVMPPPATVRFRVPVPAHAVLRLGVGLNAVRKRDPAAAGVRFAVDVDGHEAFARTVNPARSRHDRRWFDAEVPLGERAREAEIVLRTAATGPGAVPGAPGWSHARVVAREWRDREPTRRDTPNLLVLLVDTLRADRLGCYGAIPSPSPTLDRLAADGLLFEDMVAQSSWTMPSVATLFTGLHPRSHGVHGRELDGSGDGTDPAFLSDAIPTLADVVRRAGITTVGVSANPTVSRATNLARGFETFVEFGWDQKQRDWEPATVVNRTFVRWLRRNRGHRFFAYLHYMEPHDPYTPDDALKPPVPSGVRGEIAAGNVELAAKKVNRNLGPPLPAAAVEYLRTLYDLEIRGWDRALAELLGDLDGLGMRESTVIVVVADHGEEFQEHGRLKHGIHLYQELLHVPLIVAGPGIGRARVREQAQGIDLFPTLAGLLGVTPPPLPGHDLRGPPVGRPAFSETRFGRASDGGNVELFSVREGSWKLITTPALGAAELYDLARDPMERDDRFGRAGEGEELARMLSGWQASAPAPPPVEQRDPRLREKLRALGYVD